MVDALSATIREAQEGLYTSEKNNENQRNYPQLRAKRYVFSTRDRCLQEPRLPSRSACTDPGREDMSGSYDPTRKDTDDSGDAARNGVDNAREFEPGA